MGEDLSAGAKIGIVLVVLCAIIATVFSIMALVKNVTNQSVDDLQSSLSAFQNLKWQDYDQRIVSGNTVQVTVRAAADDNVAVVIKTNKNNKKHVNYGVLLTGAKEDTSDSNYYTSLVADKDPIVKPDASGSFYVGQLQYKTTTVTGGDGKSSTTTVPGYMYSRYTKGINDPADFFYINPTLKFNSFLIKDSSGGLLGIYFEEVNPNA